MKNLSGMNEKIAFFINKILRLCQCYKYSQKAWFTSIPIALCKDKTYVTCGYFYHIIYHIGVIAHCDRHRLFVKNSELWLLKSMLTLYAFTIYFSHSEMVLIACSALNPITNWYTSHCLQTWTHWTIYCCISLHNVHEHARLQNEYAVSQYFFNGRLFTIYN